MKYEHYRVEDLVSDKSFREWVLSSDYTSDTFWKRWAESHPQKRKLIDEAKEIVLSVERDQINFSENKNQEMWKALTKVMEEDSIVDNILGEDSKREIPKTSPSALPQYIHDIGGTKSNKGGLRHLGIAASIAVVLGLSFGLYQFYGSENVANTPDLAQYIKRENPPGVKSVIALADGTKVTLNAASSLEFPKGFKGEERLVYLEGEAFFEVQKNPEKPFIVITNKIATTALGTSFNIHAFPDKKQINVFLVEGKVKVEAFEDLDQQQKTKETFLAPGEQVIYKKDKQALKKGKFDSEIAIAWKEGILYFRKADFEEIIDKLEKWYGVKFKILNQNQQNMRFSGTFQNETLKNILEAISYSQRFEYQINGDHVTINFNN
ncbi:DUF4974 domain-containing protein [Fulvivirgaceae bacterium BMA12]|uniref:DUF4974 domain-containing protein n=1 Tax=Agaribacillus aureus TaxID=3051825 RepID=A0ABT8LD79_9BACT|nr:DUF4974 domain-containing protein [Fulvivirgaceae bacterium BMA12]